MSVLGPDDACAYGVFTVSEQQDVSPEHRGAIVTKKFVFVVWQPEGLPPMSKAPHTRSPPSSFSQEEEGSQREISKREREREKTSPSSPQTSRISRRSTGIFWNATHTFASRPRVNPSPTPAAFSPETHRTRYGQQAKIATHKGAVTEVFREHFPYQYVSP